MPGTASCQGLGDWACIQTSTQHECAGRVYEVVQQLPGTGSEPEYRIKSANEPHQRVARQSELTKA
jgi:hypothetical protein